MQLFSNLTKSVSLTYFKIPIVALLILDTVYCITKNIFVVYILMNENKPEFASENISRKSIRTVSTRKKIIDRQIGIGIGPSACRFVQQIL